MGALLDKRFMNNCMVMEPKVGFHARRSRFMLQELYVFGRFLGSAGFLDRDFMKVARGLQTKVCCRGNEKVRSFRSCGVQGPLAQYQSRPNPKQVVDPVGCRPGRFSRL
jgi:hypothetical protein